MALNTSSPTLCGPLNVPDGELPPPGSIQATSASSRSSTPPGLPLVKSPYAPRMVSTSCSDMVSPLLALPRPCDPPYAHAGGQRKGFAGQRCPGGSNALRNSLRSADIRGMQQHCVQCLSEVLANGRNSPAGE